MDKTASRLPPVRAVGDGAGEVEAGHIGRLIRRGQRRVFRRQLLPLAFGGQRLVHVPEAPHDFAQRLGPFPQRVWRRRRDRVLTLA